MNKRAQNKIDNDTAIVDAALKLFAENGLEGTTISDIVRASGLARGTFYNYYKSKEEIWEQLINTLGTRINDTIGAQRRQAQTAYQFVYEAFLGYAKVLQEPTILALVIRNQAAFRKTLFSSSSIESIYRDLENDLKNSPFFANLLPDQHRLTSYSMVGTAMEIIIQSHDREKPLEVEEIARFFTQLFLGGIDKITQDNLVS